MLMDKVKVEILTDGVRLDGVDRTAGEIVDLPQSLLAIWQEKGYCSLVKEELHSQQKDPAEPPASSEEKSELKEPQEPPKPELNHVGGGYYLLPNGEKVHGKEAAIKAINALKGGEENGVKTNNGTDSGAGNDTGPGN